ncbi:MAG TPA: toll/interleukin-1 receptor domain-containing protein [Aquabacterium sp.]|nr:toll/interleukin-1 receptor domain-containing protein [Aquabacterium sp.]HQC97856.1 toll/interleukin-1 receptor domain-containing protein [Aquabacterium sp.]
MAYLPQFSNDLFVSYRRSSNVGDDPWVDSFCASVQAQLRDLVGEVQIWRDTAELRAGEAWRPEIASAVDSSAIFLALISRTYFDSDECRKELDRFLGCLKRSDGHAGLPDVPGGGRKLVPVFKHPPRTDQELPRELAEIGHHAFFNLDPKPWRELDPRRDHDDYHERLGRVVFDLMSTLEELHGLQKKRARGTVFVANVAPELLQERERLRSDLRQRGFRVVPEHEILWNADDHRERIARDLGEALLCVHLVQRQPSVEPLTPARTRLQLELAQAEMRQRGRPPPLVWLQPCAADAAAADPACAALVGFIENDLADQGIEVLQGSVEDLKTLVFDSLPQPAPATPPKPRQVALLVEDNDLADSGPLKTLLADRLGLEPRPLKFNGGAPRDAERLARTLAACPQAVIVWHRQSEDWVFDLLDLDALGGHLGPDRLAIVTIGADSDEKRSFTTRKARMVSAVVGSGEAELRRFFDTAP